MSGWPGSSSRMPDRISCRQIANSAGAVLYHRVPRLFDALALARGDGRYGRLLKTLGGVQLLILDGVDGLTSAAS